MSPVKNCFNYYIWNSSKMYSINEYLLQDKRFSLREVLEEFPSSKSPLEVKMNWNRYHL